MNPRSDSPYDVLGVTSDASEAEIRAAYLRKVRECPPDREGDAFERVRDAYELLRDPRRRAKQMLATDPFPAFVSLLDQQPAPRCYLGPEPWLACMRASKVTP